MFIQRKRGRAAGTTLQAPLIQCCAYTSTFRLHTSLYHTILKCQAPLSECPPSPGNLIWCFGLCFLAVGVLGVYKNRARVGCQLRIRGGRGACYRKVRPLAHPDLNVIYFHPINLLPLLIFHSAHSGLRLSKAKHSLIWSIDVKYD